MVTQNTAVPDPATLSTDPDAALDKYMLLALESLADILRDTEASARDKRLAAGTMLKYVVALRPPPPPAEEPIRETSRPLSERRQREALARHGDEEMARQDAELADAYDVGYNDALDGNDHDRTAARIADAYSRGYTDASEDKPHNPITMGMLAFDRLAQITEELYGGPDVPFMEPSSASTSCWRDLPSADADTATATPAGAASVETPA